MRICLKLYDKMKRLMGHDSLRDLCSYCRFVRKNKKISTETKKQESADKKAGEAMPLSVVWALVFTWGRIPS